MRLEIISLCVLVIAAACAIAAPAAAQTWPARPVRIIVPFAPGGGVDTVTRLLAQQFAEQIGGSFVVENRAGGAGIFRPALVAETSPDASTLLKSAPGFSANPAV